MKIVSTLDFLKSNYPQMPLIAVDQATVTTYLQKLYGQAPLTQATTDLVESDAYQSQIVTLGEKLKELDFDAEIITIMQKRFQENRAIINEYFQGQHSGNPSIPLPNANKLKKQLEELAFIAQSLSVKQRSAALISMHQFEFACLDGTLVNLEALARLLAGNASNLDQLIGETKYEIIEAALKEAYESGKLKPELAYRGHGTQVHMLKCLVNSIADDYGLLKTTVQQDKYVGWLSNHITDAVTLKARGVADSALAKPVNEFIDKLADKIQRLLPPEPEPGAEYKHLMEFQENLEAVLVRLQIAKFTDLTIAKSIPDEEYMREVAMKYKPSLQALIGMYIVAHLNAQYLQKSEILIKAIREYLEDANYEVLGTYLEQHKLGDINLMSEMILRAVVILNANTGDAVRREMDQYLKSRLVPVMKHWQWLSLNDTDEVTLKKRLALINDAYDEDGIEDISKNLSLDPLLWEVILAHCLKLNKGIYEFENALSYAINKNLQIDGKHFLIHFLDNNIQINGQHVLHYIGEHATNSEKSLLKNVCLGRKEVFIDMFNEEMQHFLKELGFADENIEPIRTLGEMLTNPNETLRSNQVRSNQALMIKWMEHVKHPRHDYLFALAFIEALRLDLDDVQNILSIKPTPLEEGLIGSIQTHLFSTMKIAH